MTLNTLQMFKQATEIQKYWKPYCGDNFAYTAENLLCENFGYYLGNISTNLRIKKYYIRDIGGIRFINKFQKSQYIWMPYFYQLYGMIDLKENYPGSFFYQLNYEIDNLLFGYYNDKQPFKNHSEILLAYVMFQKYKKLWKFGKRNWRKTKRIEFKSLSDSGLR